MWKAVRMDTSGAQHSLVLQNSAWFSPLFIVHVGNLARSLPEDILMRRAYWSVDEQQGARFKQFIQCGDHGTHNVTSSIY